MPGGMFDGALPVGMILFAGTMLAYLRRKLGKKKAVRDFPQIASELGLSFIAPRYRGAIGILSGTYRARAVRVDPDDQRMIAVRFEAAPAIDLRSYEHGRGAPHGMVTLYSGDRDFDRYFKTRFASADLAAQLAASESPGALLAPLQGSLGRYVQSLSVTADGVICRVDFGTPPYIPSSVLARILPACVALADLIEPPANSSS